VMRMLRLQRSLRLVALALVALLMAINPVLPSRFAGAQADDLIGDFTVSISSESVPSEIANGSTVVGRWRLSFKEDGTYEAERLDVGVVVRGSYEVNGDTVTVTDEEGLLSCSNSAMATGDSGDVSAATYQFNLRSNSLSFTAQEEGCALRRVLFTTTDFRPFVACTTEPLPDLAAEGDTPARPGNAAPEDILAAEATPSAGEPSDGPAPSGKTDEQIDNLLEQMTACWATGDPSRFLPLWSNDFREQFLQDETALDSLRLAMQVPLSWERAGDVRVDGDTRAEAVVRTTTLDEEEFVTYRFVFEDGAWRWDGSAA
jgi:hypothetical protein